MSAVIVLASILAASIKPAFILSAFKSLIFALVIAASFILAVSIAASCILAVVMFASVIFAVVIAALSILAVCTARSAILAVPIAALPIIASAINTEPPVTIKGAVALLPSNIANLSAWKATCDAVPPAEASASITIPATEPLAATCKTNDAWALPSRSDCTLASCAIPAYAPSILFSVAV